jgi:transglutaminase-like putative cysteine protease
MVLTSALTLVATEWATELEVLPLVGIVGLAVGLLLSLSTFRGWLSHLLSTFYGLAWVGFLMGRGLPGELSWRERILEIGVRIASWVQQALSGGTSHDALIFSLFLGILFWSLAHHAAWNTYRRGRVWVAAVPLGIVSVVAVHFYIGETPLIRYLALYLLLAILYVGRAHIFGQQEIWRRKGVAYDPSLGMAILRSSLVLALLVMTLAWTLPSTSSASTSASEVWERINTPWETVEEEWQRLFSSIHSGEKEIAEPFGTSLALGGASNLKDTLVLDIEAPPATRYYWRAAVYATYNGSQWDPPEGGEVRISPGEQATAAMDDASRRPVTQTVTNYLAGRRVLVGASQLTAVDRDVKASVRLEDGAPVAFHRLSSVQPLGAGEQYTVTSRISQADGAGLRQAGTDYPAWVRERYLKVPDALPERVRILAERVAGEAENPYDQARLLERYLRETITYDLTPPSVPEGRDYVDFLLFDSQRAYCNGYTTAMVVMARNLGIPARLVTGYAQGTYDEERHVFRVREDNAHSWPEIYFPGYGWTEFEPTASQDPLNRPEPASGAGSEFYPPERPMPQLDDLNPADEGPAPTSQDGTGAVPDDGILGQGARLRRWAAGGLVLAALVATAWWAARRTMRNRRFRRPPAVEQIYARLLRLGRWLGRPLRTPDTPLEWARDLSAIVPKARDPIRRLVGIYVEAQFGQGDSRDPTASISWRQARALLWRHLLWEQWIDRLGFASRSDA